MTEMKANIHLSHFAKDGMRITIRVLDYPHNLNEDAVVEIFDAHRDRTEELISEMHQAINEAEV